MLDQRVGDAPGEREVYVRILMMELVSCLNDAVELAVELSSEQGVETFLITPEVRPKRGGDAFNADQASGSLKAILSSSDESWRQLAFNAAWAQAKREDGLENG